MKTGASQHTFLQAYSDTGDFNLFVDDNLNGYIIYTRCFVLQPSTKKSIVVLVFGSCFILILIPHYSHIAGYDTTHRISIEGLDDSYTISHMNESQRYQFRSLFYLEFAWIVSSGFFGDAFSEAPAMFKRDNVYYGWFAVCGLGFAGCGLRVAVCGLRFVVCGLWFVVCGLWFVVYGLLGFS